MKKMCDRRFRMYFHFVAGRNYDYDELARKYRVSRRTIENDIKFFKEKKYIVCSAPNYVEGGFVIYKIKNRRDY